MATAKEIYVKLTAEWTQFDKNAQAFFEKGNKAAGTRSRVASKEIGKLCKEWRKISVKESK